MHFNRAAYLNFKKKFSLLLFGKGILFLKALFRSANSPATCRLNFLSVFLALYVLSVSKSINSATLSMLSAFIINHFLLNSSLHLAFGSRTLSLFYCQICNFCAITD